MNSCKRKQCRPAAVWASTQPRYCCEVPIEKMDTMASAEADKSAPVLPTATRWTLKIVAYASISSHS